MKIILWFLFPLTYWIYFDVISPKSLVDEISNDVSIQDQQRGGIFFNRADFHTQPYGSTFEAPVVLGISQTQANGWIAVQADSYPVFFILTENEYGCEIGEVSERAKELGAVALVISPNTDDDLYRYVDYNGSKETIPTLIVESDFVRLSIPYATSDQNDDHLVFKADYTLGKRQVVDYKFFMPMNPQVDAIVVDSFFRYAQFYEDNIDFQLNFKMLRQNPDWSSNDYLDNTDFCLIDPNGQISGHRLIAEVVRQYWILSATGRLSVLSAYLLGFYESCVMNFEEDWSASIVLGLDLDNTASYESCVEQHRRGGQDSIVADYAAQWAGQFPRQPDAHYPLIYLDNNELYSGRPEDIWRTYWAQSLTDEPSCDTYICSYDCFQEMKSNGVCETACRTTECGNDTLDCSLCPFWWAELASDGSCDSECWQNENWVGEEPDWQCSNSCITSKNDGQCDPACNIEICDFDGVDCLFNCPEGWLDKLDNQMCDVIWNVEAWNFDNQACEYCNDDCQSVFVFSDNRWDSSCYTAWCKSDYVDWERCLESDCLIQLLGDGFCHQACNSRECNYDGHDCENLPSYTFNDVTDHKEDNTLVDSNTTQIIVTVAAILGAIIFLCIVVSIYFKIRYSLRHEQYEAPDTARNNVNVANPEISPDDIKLNFPKISFSRNILSKGDQTCTICLSDLWPKENIRKLPCEHIFHVECIDAWLLSPARNKVCPNCFQDPFQKPRNEKDPNNSSILSS